MEMKIVLLRAEIVQQDDGAVAASEKMLQRQDLAPVPKRALREQAQLGQTIKHDARRIDPLDLIEDEFCRLAQFQFGGMENGEFAIRVERRLGGHELENVDPLERPAVTLRDKPQFSRGLGQGDVENPLAMENALKQKLQRDRGLAGARMTLVEIEPVAIKPAAEDVV